MFTFSKKKKTSKLNAVNEHFAVISFKPDGTIIEANQNFLNTLGYTLDEIIGKKHSIFCESKFVTSNEYKNFWHNLNKA